jgi:porphobilinogen synthase
VLPAGTYKILVDGVEKDFGATGDFSPGMTLRWDSGTEKVGTVSVVYTSDKGVSTLLADKKIGKAGSGGSGGDGFEDKYTIIKRVNWQAFLDEVLSSPQSINHNGLHFGDGKVYVDNGEYWVAYYGKFMSIQNATSRPTIQSYVDARPSEYILMKIDMSNKIYNESDITKFNQPWKSTPYPVRGSLYKYNGFLYICQNAGSTTSGSTISRNPNSNGPYSGDWLKIAIIKS